MLSWQWRKHAKNTLRVEASDIITSLPAQKRARLQQLAANAALLALIIWGLLSHAVHAATGPTLASFLKV